MTQERPQILLVDDEVLSLQTLTRILDDEFEVRSAASVAEALRILEEEWIQAVISDQRMPDLSGVEFLSRVRDEWPDVVRMIISGYTDPGDIIDGINRAGIFQYITKPWHPEQLLLSVRNACRLHRLQCENDALALEMRTSAEALATRLDKGRARLRSSFDLSAIVRTPGSAINAVCEQLERVAPYDIPVLITGESGTGKELFARALHYNGGRADRPFVAENCGAMPDQLLESELFGHKKGAFTGACSDRIGLFEQADGGTIFLDEIGDVSAAFQVKLLRVLQEGEIRPIGTNQRRRVDVRVITATNRDLEAEMRAGRFREDLFYRIAGMRLHLPPLRERTNDIPAIAAILLERAVRAFGKPGRGFTPDALACMADYHWPGNVRELQNEVQRMLVLAPGEWLGAELLSARVVRAAPVDEEQVHDFLAAVGGGLRDRIEALEARILKETLVRHRWNKSRAAEELGLSRVGLRKKLERYGLEPTPSG